MYVCYCKDHSVSQGIKSPRHTKSQRASPLAQNSWAPKNSGHLWPWKNKKNAPLKSKISDNPQAKGEEKALAPIKHETKPQTKEFKNYASSPKCRISGSAQLVVAFPCPQISPSFMKEIMRGLFASSPSVGPFSRPAAIAVVSNRQCVHSAHIHTWGRDSVQKDCSLHNTWWPFTSNGGTYQKDHKSYP